MTDWIDPQYTREIPKGYEEKTPIYTETIQKSNVAMETRWRLTNLDLDYWGYAGPTKGWIVGFRGTL